MPNYYAAGISIHLTTGPLTLSTNNTFDSRQSAHPQETRETTLPETDYSQRMLEESVDCFDDQNSGMPKFLGPYMNMPFFCVAVRQRQPKEIPSFCELTTPISKRTRASGSESSGLSSAPPSPDEEDIETLAGPQTRLLSLRERTKAQTSTSSLVKAQKKLNSSKGPPAVHHSTIPKSLPTAKEASESALYLAIGVDAARSFCRSNTGFLRDIKVEYFVNGNFAGSTYWAFRFRHDEKTSMVRSFSGLRINRREEQAWVFRNPAFQNDRGPFKNILDDIERTEKAGSRWEGVANALQLEANLRGMDPHGKYPPSAEYLAVIANMPEPPLLKRKSTARKFGVIDVLVTLGHGKKFAPEAGHLREPRRMVDDRFSPVTVPETPLHSLGAGADLTPRMPPQKVSELLAKTTEKAGPGLSDLRGLPHQPFHLQNTSQSQPYSEEKFIADSKVSGRGSHSSETFSPCKQSTPRNTNAREKCTPRERMKRAPLGVHDTSKLQPILALEDFTETVQPIYQITAAPSAVTISTADTSKLKLIFTSSMLGSSKLELGLAALEELDDHPEDLDFSPKKQKPGKQKKTRGRGQNWRRGLRKYDFNSQAKDSAAASDNPIPALSSSTPALENPALGTPTTTPGIWAQASDVGSSSPPAKKRKSNSLTTGMSTRVSRSTVVQAATESAKFPLTTASSSPAPNHTTKDPAPRHGQLPLKTSTHRPTSPVGQLTSAKPTSSIPEGPTTRVGLLQGKARSSASANLATTNSDTSSTKLEDSARRYPLVAPPPRSLAEMKSGKATRPKPRPGSAIRTSAKPADRQSLATMPASETPPSAQSKLDEPPFTLPPHFRATRAKAEAHAQPEDRPFLPSPNGVLAITPKEASKSSRPVNQTPSVHPTATPKSTASEESFTVPALSKDCVITYLPGATRKVPLERPGEFMETEVLMGVRFLALG